MPSPNRGLPSRGQRAFGKSLDSLTDPGPAPTSAVRPVPAPTDTRDDSDHLGTLDTRGNSGHPGDSVQEPGGAATPTRPRSPSRQHVKVRSDLVDQMRNAVWFLSEHGRPRVQLVEVFDEAVEQWLTANKQRYNDGEDFPERGRLR